MQCAHGHAVFTEEHDCTVEGPEHGHTCKCGTKWRHSAGSHGCHACHECPSCGLFQFDKDEMSDEEWAREKAFLARKWAENLNMIGRA